MSTFLNYLRYIFILGFIILLFFSYELVISKDTIQSGINNKVPMTIEKLGTVTHINEFTINSINDGFIDSTIVGIATLSENNIFKSEKTKGFISKFLKKDKKIIEFIDKKHPYVINLKAKPIIRGSRLSLKVKDMNIENIKSSDRIKKIVTSFVEKISIKNAQLDSIGFFASIKSVIYDSDNVYVSIGVSKIILFLLIILFSLREIGLLLIIFYQTFLSDKKNYKCAKGAINGTGTCSNTTKQAFKDGGFIKGMTVYFSSKKECRKAYDSSKSSSNNLDLVYLPCEGIDSARGKTSACVIGDCDIGPC